MRRTIPDGIASGGSPGLPLLRASTVTDDDILEQRRRLDGGLTPWTG
jgi:hypothetical protein